MVFVDGEALRKLSGFLIKNKKKVTAFDFCSPPSVFPKRNETSALFYFFTASLNQYGFWLHKNKKYTGPMFLKKYGLKLKGSYYFFMCLTEYFRRNNPSVYSLAALKFKEFKEIFKSENGVNIPEIKTHYSLTQKFALDLIRLDLTPEKMVDAANKSLNPPRVLLNGLKKLSGYKEDPLLKKANLLIYILSERPERFLKIKKGEVGPIVDYHIQRGLLRLGVVTIENKRLLNKIIKRTFLTKEEEAAVRGKCFEVFKKLIRKTNLTAPQIDYSIFKLRNVCYENKKPDCADCFFKEICAKKTELFQPVFLTTYY